MPTINDLWYSYLVTDLGINKGTVNDMLFTFFGQEGYVGTLNDRFRAYLADQGHTGFTVDDALYAYLGDLGYVGTLQDRLYGALTDGALFGANFHAFGETTDAVIKALIKGTGPVIFARGSDATIEDFEGLIKTCLENEIRHEYGRRNHNLFSYEGTPNNDLEQGWAMQGGGVGSIEDSSTIEFTSGIKQAAYTLTNLGAQPGRTLVFTVHVTELSEIDSGDLQLGIYDGVGTTTINFAPSMTEQRLAVTRITNASATTTQVIIKSNNGWHGQVNVRDWKLEDVTGQANQNPSEDVSVGVVTSGGITGDNSTFDTGLGDWVNGDPTRGDVVWDSGVMRLTNTSGKLGYCRAALPYDFRAGVQYFLKFTNTVTGSQTGCGTADTADGATETYQSFSAGTHSLYFTPSTDASYFIFYINTITADDRTHTIDNVELGLTEHGAFVDGVRYYAKTNPCQVDGNNVVTEDAATTPITDYRTLFEPLATSVISEPEDFTTGAGQWTVVDDAETSESANDSIVQGQKWWRLEAATTSSSRRQIFSIAHTKDAAAETWMLSVFVEADEVDWISLQIQNSGNTKRVIDYFDLSTPTTGTPIETTWTHEASGIEEIATGIYRCWMKVTTDTDTSIRGRIGLASADGVNTFSATDGDGVNIIGCNLVEEDYEIGPSSYFGGTGSATYSRASDDPSPMFDIANWDGEIGTWYLDIWWGEISDVGSGWSIFGPRDGLSNVFYYDGVIIKASNGATNSRVDLAAALTDNRFRLVADFKLNDTLELGYRDVDGVGIFDWDDTPAAHTQEFVSSGALYILRNVSEPIRLRDLIGYKGSRKGKDWVEDNL